jgi:hypothetical protein
LNGFDLDSNNGSSFLVGISDKNSPFNIIYNSELIKTGQVSRLLWRPD